MKKLHPTSRDSVHRRGLMRWQNTLSRKYKNYNPYRYNIEKIVGGKLIITAPVKISIYDFSDQKSKCQYYQTLKFIDLITKNFRKRDCVLDFTSTTRISAAALVVIYAAIETAYNVRPGESEIAFSNKSETVNRTLRNMNIHKLIQGNKIEYELNKTKILPIISSIGNKHMEKIVDFIQLKVLKTSEPNKEYIYGSAISETINNVEFHAYPNEEPSSKRWWLVCNTIRDQLFLAIYDNGIGIPDTVVSRKWFFPSLQSTHPKIYQRLIEEFPEDQTAGFNKLGRIIPDERLIHISMKGDVTSTNEDKHGQGSKSIMALVGDTPRGKLWVFSNRGLYTYFQNEDLSTEKKLPRKFPGTLIQWNIKLS